VRDGALDARHLEECLLCLFDTLGDRRGHLLGLAVADADGAVTVTDHYQCSEAEATTTLDDLRHPVDRDNPLDECALVRTAVATATATAVTTATATATAA
jgi:hypothetical protein